MSTTPAAPVASAEPKKLTIPEFLGKLSGAAKDRDAARAEVARQAALLAVVATFLGLKVEELNTKKPEDLKAALDAKAGAACQADANNEAVKNATTAKTTAEGKATAAEALTQVYVTGLSSVKISVSAADAAKGLQASDVTAALNARVNTLAGEKLAELGFPEGGLPPSNNTGADSTGDFASKVKHFNSLTGPERDDYYTRVIAPEMAKGGSN